MEKTPKYEYLVSYFHSTGLATSYILRPRKIDSTAEALALQRFIEEENGHKNVGIINFILLRVVWA